jgi:hypothetical protein
MFTGRSAIPVAGQKKKPAIARGLFVIAAGSD